MPASLSVNHVRGKSFGNDEGSTIPRSPYALAMVLVLMLSGCGVHRHAVAFNEVDTSWHYAVTTPKYDCKVVAVIDGDTLSRAVSIHSVMAGTANVWDALPGEMLRQAMDVELAQMFTSYERATSHEVSDFGVRRLTLVLTIPNYRFEDFKATVTVQATAYGPAHATLLDKDYGATGISQGSKMFWLGAFGMESAIRQSTLDAYKRILAELRGDLSRVVESMPVSEPGLACFTRITKGDG